MVVKGGDGLEHFREKQRAATFSCDGDGYSPIGTWWVSASDMRGALRLTVCFKDFGEALPSSHGENKVK